MNKITPAEDQRLSKATSEFMNGLKIADYHPAGLAYFCYYQGRMDELLETRATSSTNNQREGEKLRWVKASERLPIDGESKAAKTQGRYLELRVSKEGIIIAGGYSCHTLEILEEWFPGIEWLEETDVPAAQSSETPSLPVEPEDEVRAFSLSNENIKLLLDNSLKPEEIAGEESVQHDRVSELIRWFVRHIRGEANSKWFQPHAYELAYYIATNAVSRHINLDAVKMKAWLEGVQISPSERDFGERHGFIPKTEPQALPLEEVSKGDDELPDLPDDAKYEIYRSAQESAYYGGYDHKTFEHAAGWMWRVKEKELSSLRTQLAEYEAALEMSEVEITAMYKRVGVKGSNILDLINNTLQKFKSPTA